MKVMEYNIWCGFHDRETHALSSERLKLAREIVRKEDPDILVLTEARYGSDNPYGVSMNYQELFDFPFYFYAPWGIGWGNCILSKYPLVGEIVSAGKRTAIRARIDGKLTMVVVHPSPRLTELGKIDDTTEALLDLPHPCIVVGDFNALSDEDGYDRDKMIRGFKTFAGDTAEAEVDMFLERKFIPWVKSLGFRDAMPASKRIFTVPADVQNKIKDSAMRIDFFFISSDVKVVDAYTIKNAQTEQASDHYPIVGVFEF